MVYNNSPNHYAEPPEGEVGTQFRSQFDDADEEDVVPPNNNFEMFAPPRNSPAASSRGAVHPNRVMLPSNAAFNASVAEARAAAKRAQFALEQQKKKMMMKNIHNNNHEKIQPAKPAKPPAMTKKPSGSGNQQAFSPSDNRGSQAARATHRKTQAARDSTRFRPVIPNLSPHDVLVGLDVGVFPNAGNQFFRRLIRLRQETFRMAKSKPMVQQAIIQYIYDIVKGLSPPGRFKARGNNSFHGEWMDIGEAQALAFIAASLAEGITGLVGWQPPIFPKSRPVIATASDDDDSDSSGAGKKRPSTNHQKRKYTKKQRTSPPANTSNPRKHHHRQAEVIEIESSSQSEDEDVRYDHTVRLGSQRVSTTSPLERPLLPGALNQRADALRHISESVALASAGTPAQYHPDALAQLRAGGMGMHHHQHLHGGDPSGAALTTMSRLGRVPSTIPASMLLGTPASMLLGTPPAMENIHHSAAGLHHGGMGVLPGGGAQHLHHYGALGGADSLMGTGGLDPHLMAANNARQYDDYIHHRHLDGRGE